MGSGYSFLIVTLFWRQYSKQGQIFLSFFSGKRTGVSQGEVVWFIVPLLIYTPIIFPDAPFLAGGGQVSLCWPVVAYGDSVQCWNHTCIWEGYADPFNSWGDSYSNYVWFGKIPLPVLIAGLAAILENVEQDIISTLIPVGISFWEKQDFHLTWIQMPFTIKLMLWGFSCNRNTHSPSISVAYLITSGSGLTKDLCGIDNTGFPVRNVRYVVTYSGPVRVQCVV